MPAMGVKGSELRFCCDKTLDAHCSSKTLASLNVATLTSFLPFPQLHFLKSYCLSPLCVARDTSFFFNTPSS